MSKAFSNSYSEARDKFLHAAHQSNCKVDSRIHPALGPDGETLATDCVVLGSPTAPKALYVTSGVHGVEGYFGSGVMVQWLTSNISIPKDCKIVLVHACNPHGFAWGRRFTEENVDLNRNFWPLDQPAADNPDYAAIQHLVEYRQTTTQEFASVQQQRAAYIQQHGADELKIALAKGQTQNPKGLFFAGTQATWARKTFENLVADNTQGCDHVFFLDLHTGLGPSGYADFLHDYPSGSQDERDLCTYIGERILGKQRDKATAQAVPDTTQYSFHRAAHHSAFKTLGGTIECGTLPLEEVMEALLQEAALYRHGCDDHALAENIRSNLKDAFYVNTDVWKCAVLEQTTDIKDGALRYLIAQ